MKTLRSEIKHNFLKQIMFRLDYEGTMEADISEGVLALRQDFFDAGFVNMNERTENQVDVQLKMNLNIPDENSFSVNNTNKNLVYSFSSPNNEMLELSKNFFTLTINIDKIYESFDKYIELLAKTIDKVRSTSPYFRALRMGLRKINICYLDDLADLAVYFTKGAFNIDDIVLQFTDCRCIASNMVTILMKEGYRVNYIRNLQEGVRQLEDGKERTAYQVVLDVDVYKEGHQEIAPSLSNKKDIRDILTKQNTIEFEIFIKSLKKEFIEELKKDTFADERIRGVDDYD